MTRFYLLDTGTTVCILTGASPAARYRLTRLGKDEVACVSAVTAAELWHELERIGGSERLRRPLGMFLDRIRVLPWGGSEALAYGAFRSRQEASGQPLGPLDAQIAVQAIAAGAVLVTNDATFERIHGLPGIESWTTDLPPGHGSPQRASRDKASLPGRPLTGWLRARLARLRFHRSRL